jgi:hypothetical protein
MYLDGPSAKPEDGKHRTNLGMVQLGGSEGEA